MADGFLNRWSRRKSGLENEAQDPLRDPKSKSAVPVAQDDNINQKGAQEVEVELPLPTLEDAEKIDRFAPDFSAFMRPNVDPAVQQAAMKKLFSDPHFNIMDRLDIYIDDYSIADPIPMEMLKRMVQSQSLGLFRKREEENSPHLSSESPVELSQTEVLGSELTHSKIDPDATLEDVASKANRDDASSQEQVLSSLDDSSKKKIE